MSRGLYLRNSLLNSAYDPQTPSVRTRNPWFCEKERLKGSFSCWKWWGSPTIVGSKRHISLDRSSFGIYNMETHGCSWIKCDLPFSPSPIPTFFDLRNHNIPDASTSLGLDAACSSPSESKLNCFVQRMENASHKGLPGPQDSIAQAEILFRVFCAISLSSSKEPTFMGVWAEY